jgi:hypothetical protein
MRCGEFRDQRLQMPLIGAPAAKAAGVDRLAYLNPRLGRRRIALEHITQQSPSCLHLPGQPQEHAEIGRGRRVSRSDIEGLAHRHLCPLDVVAAIAHDAEIDPGVREIGRKPQRRGELRLGVVEPVKREQCQADHVDRLRHLRGAPARPPRRIERLAVIAQGQQGRRKIQKRRRIIRQKQRAVAEFRGGFSMPADGMEPQTIMQLGIGISRGESMSLLEQAQRTGRVTVAQPAQAKQAQRVCIARLRIA